MEFIPEDEKYEIFMFAKNWTFPEPRQFILENKTKHIDRLTRLLKHSFENVNFRGVIERKAARKTLPIGILRGFKYESVIVSPVDFHSVCILKAD